ncbi:hypothetical protein GWO43_17110 [candidate division KSB1 bacterium]|nr:hypothetical protein [candidate division KSB1 bacterium]NIR69182.1 hypothetical protein [candidate division KSB1 bacterium]NIS25693.1 hypothetical protein [candidate division KSB1 bacterium]NIT72561.1 hypothetical protein [candidate division KSB1 bacterium]NIU26370.1 hypothetical protein [candidate division KSB1 bacterium]
MRSFTTQLVVWLTVLSGSVASGQTKETFWIESFSPESADLNDSSINQKALARLDSLMQIPSVSVTFYGADDSLAWQNYCTDNQIENKDKLNTRRRLSRARALKKRYGRGNIGITRENVAGVKVVWSVQMEDAEQASELEPIRIPGSGSKESTAVSGPIKVKILENEIKSPENQNESQEK